MKNERHNPEHPRLAVFTVCADSELARVAQQHLPGIEFAGAFEKYITATLRPHFPQAVRKASAGVAFIDFDKSLDQAIETVAALQKIPSLHIFTVGVSSRADAGVLLRAMRAGCCEFLEKPVEATKFEEILTRLEGRVPGPSASSGSRGQVISLLGAKGGVGTTTLAVHLAVALATRSGKNALLIDLHHQLGHVCLHLGLKESHYHFAELMQNVERLDTHLLQGYVLKHDSGLDVLGSPDRCATHYCGTNGEIEQVLTFLRHEYDYIVIDSSMTYGDTTAAYGNTIAATIQFSDQFYLVTTPDVAALRDLSRHVAHIGLNEAAARKGRIIVNRATSHDAIGPEHIEKVVRAPISISVPNHYEELLRAINAGQPIPPQRHSGFTAQITKWAGLVAAGGDSIAMVGAANATKKKRAFWR